MSAQNADQVNGDGKKSIEATIMDNFGSLSKEECEQEMVSHIHICYVQILNLNETNLNDFYLHFDNQATIQQLILDETNIGVISESDKTFLEKFKNLNRIALNLTKMKTLNLPSNWKLESVSCIKAPFFD